MTVTPTSGVTCSAQASAAFQFKRSSLRFLFKSVQVNRRGAHSKVACIAL